MGVLVNFKNIKYPDDINVYLELIGKDVMFQCLFQCLSMFIEKRGYFYIVN